MMSWRRKEPGHQQPWYLLCWTELIRSPHVINIKIVLGCFSGTGVIAELLGMYCEHIVSLSLYFMFNVLSLHWCSVEFIEQIDITYCVKLSSRPGCSFLVRRKHAHPPYLVFIMGILILQSDKKNQNPRRRMLTIRVCSFWSSCKKAITITICWDILLGRIRYEAIIISTWEISLYRYNFHAMFYLSNMNHNSGRWSFKSLSLNDENMRQRIVLSLDKTMAWCLVSTMLSSKIIFAYHKNTRRIIAKRKSA